MSNQATSIVQPNVTRQSRNLLVYCCFNLSNSLTCWKNSSPPETVPCTIITQEWQPQDQTARASLLDNLISWREQDSTSGSSSYTDCNGIVHYSVSYGASMTRWRHGIKPRHCSFCPVDGQVNSGGWAHHFCNHCQKVYIVVQDQRIRAWIVFHLYVETIHRTSRTAWYLAWAHNIPCAGMFFAFLCTTAVL